ncbi:rho guanyl nucleotide exchange factor [Trichoderma arundinaceum]|uniref:Rho guanyl nucleotide exchange factor n=1 Tax=Trichoderma arundinaceum TaxID=490622 RepID=A0A395NJ06_TRIAR|nr:rho guanyl nucleotide exchange factor [Trichoderma arundinaceum]
MSQDIDQGFNDESVQEGDRFGLKKVRELLQLQASQIVDLRLDEGERELVFTAEFKRSPTDIVDITAFLFDHAVLLTQTKKNHKNEEFEVYRRPIPLALLDMPKMKKDIFAPREKRSSILIPFLKASRADTKKNEIWPITFHHLGKAGYELTLYASSRADQKRWREHIDIAQKRLHTKSEILHPSIVSSILFASDNKVNCAASFDDGRQLLYGTDNGIYLYCSENNEEKPQKISEGRKITQIDILEEYNLLLVLSNKTLQLYTLTNVGSKQIAIKKSPKNVQNRCSFFKAGICMKKHIVSCVKAGPLSTTVKVFELKSFMIDDEPPVGGLRFLKEFYIPKKCLSIHFLRSELCVASSQGFEVVSLDTLETQSLLDQADTTLEFAHKKGTKPIHIERVGGDFLLNYSEFSFFVNRSGWRARPDLYIDWEGTPQNFALSYPWIVAFEPNFVEIRHIETGSIRIIPHRNIRMLHENAHKIIYVFEDEHGRDIVGYIRIRANYTQ